MDTVKGYEPGKEDTATGFFINNFTENGIYATLEGALALYQHNRPVWTKLVRNAMRQDLSWDKSAQAYLDLYRKTLI